MTHPLAGHLEVDESAKTVRHYRYAVERMTRILGGWMALTPELSAKLLMGRHVWDSAQHADAWGKRLPELRAAAQVSEPANARLAVFLDAVEARLASDAQQHDRTIAGNATRPKHRRPAPAALENLRRRTPGRICSPPTRPTW